MPNLNPEEQAVLKLFGYELFNNPLDFSEKPNWYLVYRLLGAQLVRGLTEKSLDYLTAEGALEPDGEQVSATLPDSWRNSIRKEEAHYHAVAEAQQKLTDLLNANGIRFAVLKGMSAAMEYPHSAGRFSGDVDFLIREEDSEAADALLRANGYEPEAEQSVRHVSYSHHGIEFEMHRRFTPRTLLNRGISLEDDLRESMDRGEQVELDGYTFPVLSAEGRSLVFLTHMHQHFSTGFGLRQYLDWVCFAANHLRDEAYTGVFQPLFQKYQLEPFAEILTRTAQLYLGLPEEGMSWCRNADPELCGEFIVCLFRSGDLGAKPEDLGKRASRTIWDARLSGGIFHTLQRRGEENWPALKKHPSLRAFAWIWCAWNYAGIFIKSGHSVRGMAKGLSESGSRRELMKRMGLQ